MYIYMTDCVSPFPTARKQNSVGWGGAFVCFRVYTKTFCLTTLQQYFNTKEATETEGGNRSKNTPVEGPMTIFTKTKATKANGNTKNIEMLAPPWGLSTPRAPKRIFSDKKLKTKWSRNMCFSYGFASHFA